MNFRCKRKLNLEKHTERENTVNCLDAFQLTSQQSLLKRMKMEFLKSWKNMKQHKELEKIFLNKNLLTSI